MFTACGMNTSCDVKVTFGNPICWINLPGKTSIINYFGNCNDVCNRTAIRHRWTGVNAPRRTSDALLRNSAN